MIRRTAPPPRYALLGAILAVAAGIIPMVRYFTPPVVTPPTPLALYISPSGSDVNSCTLSQPCATLTHVAGYAQPGSIITALPGVYATVPQTITLVGTSSQPILVTTTGPVTMTRLSSPSASAQSAPLLTFANAHYLTVQGLAIAGMWGRTDASITPTVPYSGEVQISETSTHGGGVTFQNGTVYDSLTAGIAVSATQNTLIKRDTLSGDVNGLAVYGGANVGLQVISNTITGASDYAVRLWDGDATTPITFAGTLIADNIHTATGSTATNGGISLSTGTGNKHFVHTTFYAIPGPLVHARGSNGTIDLAATLAINNGYVSDSSGTPTATTYGGFALATVAAGSSVVYTNTDYVGNACNNPASSSCTVLSGGGTFANTTSISSDPQVFTTAQGALVQGTHLTAESDSTFLTTSVLSSPWCFGAIDCAPQVLLSDNSPYGARWRDPFGQMNGG